MEKEAGNAQRAFRHFVIAAKAGYEKSLDMVKQGFTKGDVTKDEYANVLRACQKQQDEMKSGERDKASTQTTRMRQWQ